MPVTKLKSKNTKEIKILNMNYLTYYFTKLLINKILSLNLSISIIFYGSEIFLCCFNTAYFTLETSNGKIP